MRYRQPIIAILATVVGGLLPACRSPVEDAEADDVPLKPVPVRVATVTRTTLQPSIDLIGTIVPIPERTSRIAAQTDGRITSVLVIEGQNVEAGSTLITLDSRPAEARLDGALAAAERARATLEKLLHGPRADEIEAARQTARQLAATARSLGRKLDALRPLHEKGEVSDIEFEQTKGRFEAAEAESAAAEAHLHLLEAGTRPEELAEARADLARAEADVADARLAVEFATIRSPIGGVVVDLAARLGASVTPGDVLASVVDSSRLFVQARIPSAYFPGVQPGAAAEVRSGGQGRPPVNGSVARLAAQADSSTGNVDVYVSVINEHGLFVPGLACRTRIWLPPVNEALSIPAAAIADRDGTPVVTVIRDSKAYEQAVTLGVSAGEQVQVVSGLEAGDVVATEGGYGLPDGCPVVIQSVQPESRAASELSGTR